jgi:hypothetical protein
VDQKDPFPSSFSHGIAVVYGTGLGSVVSITAIHYQQHEVSEYCYPQTCVLLSPYCSAFVGVYVRQDTASLTSCRVAVDLYLHALKIMEAPQEAGAIYLDYNASCPLHPQVIDAMRPFLFHHYGNPSSSHMYGKKHWFGDICPIHPRWPSCALLFAI